MNESRVFIAVAGNIGSGKTTLTQMLSEQFGWTAHYEAVEDNPYLVDFYKDMKRWSFPLQVFFLNRRFQAHQGILGATSSAIQDRTIYEDANIFARNLFDQGYMEPRDYRNYLDLYHSICGYLTPPDLMIYLRKSVPVLKRWIQKRGRQYEQSIPDVYLESLGTYYDDWMAGYRQGKKLIIESDELNFVDNPHHFRGIVDRILATLDQRDIFLDRRASAT